MTNAQTKRYARDRQANSSKSRPPSTMLVEMIITV